MKNITIQIPPEGTTVQFVLCAGSPSGQAVIVASNDVEVRMAEPSPAPAISSKAPARDLDSILKRLTKLKPSRRAAAINSIKAMFQLTDPISEDDASKLLAALCKRGSLSIDANDKLQYRAA